MSGEIEYYVGMRVIAQGREGTIAKVNSHGYDVNFADGQMGHNVAKANVTPYETVTVAKQVAGPPPPSYTPSVGPPNTGVEMAPPSSQQYQYPTSQPMPQYQQQQPQYVQQGTLQQPQYVQQQQQHYVGVSSVPVVHGVSASAPPVSVSAAPVHLAAPGNNTQVTATKLAGYEHSPNIGAPFADAFDCDSTCMMSCCCPCIVGGQVAQKLNMSSYALVCGCYIFACVVLLIIHILAASALPWLLLWIGWSIFVCIARMKVREMFKMKGDGCDDCCITFCCTACSLAQVILNGRYLHLASLCFALCCSECFLWVWCRADIFFSQPSEGTHSPIDFLTLSLLFLLNFFCIYYVCL
jgi:Cys-rich protein (TIGR01571 family)